MVSGIPTASGYEERIRFSELEVVDAGAIDHGVLSTMPEGHYNNGWDVNVAGVRTTMVKRNIRYHKHAVGLIYPSKNKHILNYSRNSYFGSSGKESSNSLLVEDMEISTDFTKDSAPNYLARFSHQCREKTSRVLQHRIS